MTMKNITAPFALLLILSLPARAAEADSTAAGERHHELNEITVKADRFIRGTDKVTVTPTREQIRHSWTGYELIRNLMIPGVSVDDASGTVKAFGSAVALYIDGLPADEREVRQLRPKDVARVQFIDSPTGRYAGDRSALNFILKERRTGGYVAIDARQHIGYTRGEYNLAAKAFNGNTQYTLFAGADFSDIKGGGLTRHEHIFFPGAAITRDYTSDGSHEKENGQYAQLRVRNKNERRTLRATLNVVRDATPGDINTSSLTVGGPSGSAGSLINERNSSSLGMKYSLGLSGSFKLPHNQSMEASASATAARSSYDYLNRESGTATSAATVGSSTREDFYDFQGNITWCKNFTHGNSLTFKAHEIYHVSSADYSGSHTSWQHLWSSETIVFGEYVQPLFRVAQLRLAPGLSAQSYCLHGDRRKNFIGPRAQLVLAAQPSRGHYIQLLGFYGNSYPQLAAMTAATQQVDALMQRRGNPDLKISRISRMMAVYGAAAGKVNFQLTGLFNGAWHLPLADYFFEDGTLVQSFAPDGRWQQYDISLSATWMPSSKFNAQISGGWLYNAYAGPSHLSSACWKGSAQFSCYLGNVAINGRVETPVTIAGYDLAVTRTPWLYGLTVSWTWKSLRIEAGTDNPFSRRPVYSQTLRTPEYDYDNSSYSPRDRRSAYVKVAWSIDFGKKTSRDKINVDRNIDSGILKPI